LEPDVSAGKTSPGQAEQEHQGAGEPSRGSTTREQRAAEGAKPCHDDKYPLCHAERAGLESLNVLQVIAKGHQPRAGQKKHCEGEPRREPSWHVGVLLFREAER
jgi:hypothetical protein